MNRCLGRNPSEKDPRTLRFAQYAAKLTTPPPADCGWHRPITDWGVMGNDQYGNCVIVTAAHMILGWRANESNDTRRLTDSAVIALSREMGAMNGYNILQRLKYWRTHGMWANQIWAYVAIDPTNHDAIRNAVNMFGAVDIGVNLPDAWRDADIWDTGYGSRYRPGSWGGHSVPILGYDPQRLYVPTWGDCLPMTWDALDEYVDEAYAVISPSWIEADALSPSGFDLPALHADLMALQE